MKTDIWMPLYINDYLADTLHLTAEESGAYMLIILNYWKRGGIGGDIDRICKYSRCACSITQALLEEFFEYADGEWKHHRIDREMVKAKQNKTKKKERAQKAASARWEKTKKDACSNANAMLEECPSPSSSPISTQQEENTPPTPQGVVCVKLDDVIKYWNNKGNLPRSLPSLNISNYRALGDIVNGYGLEYISIAIDNLSDNCENIERRYVPGSLKSFLENSVARWHDYRTEKKPSVNREEVEKLAEEVFG